MTFRDLIALETFALGMIGVVTSEIAARFALATESSGFSLSLIMLLATLVGAIAFATRPLRCAAPFVLAIIWFARTGSELGDALYEATDVTLWVSAAQAATIATAMLKLATRDTDKSAMAAVPARATASIMLLLFAYVHLWHRQAIAELVPPSLPVRSVLPLISGSVMAVAGVWLWVPRRAWPASLAVAIMFMAWVPLIHAPRLAADPTNTAEWRFAFMALCLAGCLMVTGREHLPGSRSRAQWRAIQSN